MGASEKLEKATQIAATLSESKLSKDELQRVTGFIEGIIARKEMEEKTG